MVGGVSREHNCPLPTAADYLVGQLYLCDCERLYVVRTTWQDAVCPVEVNTWKRISAKRRWWR